MHKINKWVENLDNPDFGKLAIRVALGVVFIVAGWLKVNNLEMVIGGFATSGLPVWTAYFVSYAELICGILMILGLWVRHAGIVIAVIMAVAIYKAHWANGFALANGGYEYTLVLLLVALGVVTLGAGKHTIAKLMKK